MDSSRQAGDARCLVRPYSRGFDPNGEDTREYGTDISKGGKEKTNDNKSNGQQDENDFHGTPSNFHISISR